MPEPPHDDRAEMMISAASRVLARSAPLTLGPYDSSPRTARVSARAQLSEWGRADLADDTEAVVSELVTNAVRASEQDATPVAVRLVLTDASVVVEVFDCAPGVPVAREPSVVAESGRGLQMVASMSLRWGWTPIGSGKAVWAEVAASRTSTRRKSAK
jgi:hypothetical protein